MLGTVMRIERDPYTENQHEKSLLPKGKGFILYTELFINTVLVLTR